MPSSSRVFAGILLILAGIGAAAADLAPASRALCQPTQKVMFHCSFGTKSVSLCADMASDRVVVLGYRYGTPARIELSQNTSAKRVQRFHATQSQVAPGAKVRQVWFDRSKYSYVISQCVGGSCPYDAGLAVLKGDKVLLNRRCMRSADDRARFPPELATFGADAASSQSMTDQLVFDDVDNGVERLYPVR